MVILLGSTQWNGKYGSVIIIMNDTRATYGLPLGYILVTCALISRQIWLILNYVNLIWYYITLILI